MAISKLILDIVSGIVTDGIHGIQDYITKESLQDRIAQVIDQTQNDYEKKYNCKDKSIFIWQKNIEYLSIWIKDGFLPREEIIFPIPHGENKDMPITDDEINYIYQKLDSFIKEDLQLCALHASNVNDEIYCMLSRIDNKSINPDYYNYVKSYGNVLLLHRKDNHKAITLKDTYIMPSYSLILPTASQKSYSSSNIIELLKGMFSESTQKIILIEGDAGVGKSSLIAHICYQNELSIKTTGIGIFEDKPIYCVRLRNLTTTTTFIDVPASHIRENLGFQTEAEYDILSQKGVLVLDGYDELCMIDGMVEFAEHVLAQIFRDFSDYHIILTTRPKFINISKLKGHGVYTDIIHIVLDHFNQAKRNEWIQQYRNFCENNENVRLNKIAEIDDDSSEGICDTPLALYMLAAGKISDDAWQNPWVLYNQIFYTELSNTEYNKLFSNSLYNHSISHYNDILYNISADIAYSMYKTGNKKLYVTQHDIDEIIDLYEFKLNNHAALIKRCYALCNYWKNNSDNGIAEFYHNNIRDFFLCEKIFNELEKIYKYFKIECLSDDQICNETIDKFVEFFGKLLRYSDLTDKVTEFIYYRSLYKMVTHNEEKFVRIEMENQFLAIFFEKMFIYGAIHEYSYNGKRNLYQENINVLKCIVQIYRHIYEPYVSHSKKRIEWFYNLSTDLGEMDGLPYLFKPVFIRTPLTISSSYCIPVAGYANFNILDMKKADLRYGMFSHSKFVYCDFSDTILNSTDFSNATLSNCNFENADFRYSSLLDANIEKCNFNNCNLIGTTLPDGFCSDNQEEQLKHISQFI